MSDYTDRVITQIREQGHVDIEDVIQLLEEDPLFLFKLKDTLGLLNVENVWSKLRSREVTVNHIEEALKHE